MPIGLTRIQPGGELTSMIAAINDNFAQLENLNRRYVVNDETGTPRVLLGQGADNFSGLKVSKPGFDVTTAEDDELGFNSSNNTLKIIREGTVNLSRPAGMVDVWEIVLAPQNANAFFAWATLTNASPVLTFPVNYYAPDGSGGILWGVRGTYDADQGRVKFYNESYDAAITAQQYDVTIKYYLLQETLT